jgi:hypothetical protein
LASNSSHLGILFHTVHQLGEAVNVALSLRDRKAELSNSVDEAFGCPVAERQGYDCGFAALFL